MPGGALREVAWPLALRSAGAIKESYRWLCIPGFRVEMEWRERAYVIDSPLWRRIKEHAVKVFIAEREGKPTDAVVITTGERAGRYYAYLNCPD